MRVRGVGVAPGGRRAVRPGARSVFAGVLVAGTLASAAGLTATAVPASAATTGSTVVLTDPTGGHHPYRHGAVPRHHRVRTSALASLSAARRAASQREAVRLSAKTLLYNGGITSGPLAGDGVTTGQPQVYLVFLGSQWGTRSTNGAGQAVFTGDPDQMAPALQTLFAGLGTHGETWSNILSQYCDGAPVGASSCTLGNPNVPYPSGGVLAGVWYDSSAGATSAASAGATGHQLAQEAEAAAAHFGNTTQGANRNTQYVIVSPTGSDPDGWTDPVNGYCAYHDDTEDPYIDGGGPVAGPVVAFTNLPYVPDAGAACGAGSVNSPGTLDGATEAASHEYGETVTDQFPGFSPTPGWLSSNGSEIGDLCAYSPPGFNLVLDSGTVAVQQMWSNRAGAGRGGCVAGESTFVYAPAVTGVSAKSALAGATVTVAGSNLSTATAVLFGGVAGTIVSATNGAVAAVVPAAALSGPVTVVTPQGSAATTKVFGIIPSITSFTPVSGPLGTPVSVTITGTGLGSPKRVVIGGKKAAITSASATSIVATVSVRATSGTVSVASKYGTAVASTGYTAS